MDGWLRHDEADWLQLLSEHETRLDRMCTARCTSCSACRRDVPAPASSALQS
jgi:hypothetical protein